jgi:MFS family permease
MQSVYDELRMDASTTTTSFQSWIVCLVAGLFFFYEFFQLNMLNTLEPYLMSTFRVDASEISKMSAYYFYAEIIFLFPAGLLLDRVSVRALILGSMVVCVLGTLGFAHAHTIYECSIYRFFEGLGAALCFLSSLKLASRWFHPKHLALITGILVTMAMVGGMLAQAPMERLVHVYLRGDWRQAVMYDVYMGLFCILCIIAFVKDYPDEHKKRFIQEQHQLSSMGFWESIRLAASNVQTWLAGTYTCLMNLPIFLLGALNGTLYLTQIHRLTSTQAATVSLMVFLGTTIGSPVIGYFSDVIGKRKLPMVIGPVLSIAVICVIMYTPQLSFTQAMFWFFMVGLVTSTQVLTYPLVTESNPKLVTGTALSIASLLIMSGGAIFQPLFGHFLSSHWDHQVIKGISVYSKADYLAGFYIMPAAFVVSLVLCYFIKETYCMSYEKKR